MNINSFACSKRVIYVVTSAPIGSHATPPTTRGDVRFSEIEKRILDPDDALTQIVVCVAESGSCE